MRLNTGGTVSGQAMNAGRPRQSRTPRCGTPWRWPACSCWQLVAEVRRTAKPSGPPRPPIPPACRRAGRGLSRVVADSIASPFSAVAADESRAAEVGRDVLLAGGNAADAAVAMYFAMAVTLPSAASLGASGACIVHNDKTKAAEAFVFPPIAAPGAVGGQPFTVPSGVRAITLMHVRHGSAALGGDGGAGRTAGALRRAGVARPVARSAGGRRSAGADREARRIFGGGGAWPKAARCTQPELAGTLGAIRQRGGVEFFQGQLARTLVRAGVADGRQPAARGAARRRAAGERADRRKLRLAVASMSRRRRRPAPSALAGWKGQAPGGATPDEFRRLRRPRRRRRQGRRRRLQPVDGPALRRARGRARHRRVAGSADARCRLGQPGDHRQSRQRRVHLRRRRRRRGRRRRRRPAYVAYATIEKDQPLANVLTSRGGQGGWVNAIVCPSGLRGSGASCRSAIDPAGAGLALIAR